MKRLLVFAIVGALFLSASGLLLAQNTPRAVVTWKLDVARSKYVGSQAPKSLARTVTPQGDGPGARVSTEGVAADGSRISYSYSTNYDGKDSAISGVGMPNGADTIAVTRIDPKTTTPTWKKAGKAVLTARTVVSEDGKVMTITAKGTNEQGQPTSDTTVWEKQ